MKKNVPALRLDDAAINFMGFASLILLGALLLMLPISSGRGKSRLFIDALFTTTSAFVSLGLPR